MRSKKDKEREIVLLNSEGPVLKAKAGDDGSYVLYDTEDSIVEILDLDGFIEFIFGKRVVIYTDGREFIFNKFSPSMKTKKVDIIKFIVESQRKPPLSSKFEFVKNVEEDGQWISPVSEEKEWQEDALKELFPSYPNAAPRWQYMNGLLQIGLRYKESIETDPEDIDTNEIEDDENG